MKQKHRDLWSNPEYRHDIKKRQNAGNGRQEPSIPELLFFDLFQLNELPLEYNGCGTFNINGFVPDFVNYEKKLIVEIYGFHHTTERVIPRDIARRQSYECAGYKLLEFWSYEIQNERWHEGRKDEEDIIQIIQECLR
jgi:very-short-patch-repair endonuclease